MNPRKLPHTEALVSCARALVRAVVIMHVPKTILKMRCHCEIFGEVTFLRVLALNYDILYNKEILAFIEYLIATEKL